MNFPVNYISVKASDDHNAFPGVYVHALELAAWLRANDLYTYAAELQVLSIREAGAENAGSDE